MSIRTKKVMTIGIVSELTGLSLRQIRYYEERKLISPERSKGGTRKFSFEDVEKLMEIAEKMEDGYLTFDIRNMEKAKQTNEQIRKTMLRGQLNAAFRTRR